MGNNDDADEPAYYDWDVAQVGDSRPPYDGYVDPARVAQYVQITGDRNPALRPEEGGDAAPLAMLIHMAPTGRADIMAARGFQPPLRPTPFARLQLDFLTKIRQGDTITTTSRVADKYEKRGRKYIVWEVEGRNQDGEVVVRYQQHNVWEGAKPEDRQR